MPLRFGRDEQKEFDLIKVGIASPERIMLWSYGEVEKPETINYRTFKPERRGLFCEKIFGPVKDWECHCGKYRRVRYRGIVCERCGVEVTHSRVRRERMGHIRLAVPVSHVWFLRGIPGYIGLLLDMTTRALEEVIYYDSYVVTEVSEAARIRLKLAQVLREAEYQEMKVKYGNQFKADLGAKPVRDLLAKIDLDELVKKLRKEMKGATGQKRIKIIKRLRIAEAFLQSGNRPEWMIVETLPVMPPDLRPMVQLEGGRFATSDLNDLYRRVINRNNRLKKMMAMGAPEMIIRNEKRMLQEAVDVLIDNGRRRRSVTGSTGRPLKSLTDIIEGKQGRFRQNLLGKRADYSGRSVIVVGPSLKLHQCGLPKEMALELFKPFVIRKLVERGFSQNVKNAKRMIERREVIVWDILEEVIKGHPVLLNRAPTLHRLGIQAFEPVLVEGKAIQIHPLVCPAFNADFDGDQMAVHVPILPEAQAEAHIIMLSANNLMSPASGRPIVTPTQDMVLGSYYMTVADDARNKETIPAFSNLGEAMVANDLDAVHLHEKIKVRVKGQMVETTPGRVKFNYTIGKVIAKQLPGTEYAYINELIDKGKLEWIVKDCYQKFGSAVTAEVADEVKRLGFKYATLAAISISIDDLKVPPSKKAILKKAEAEVEQLERSQKSGVISSSEKFLRSLDIWSQVTEDVTDAMLKEFDKLNSVYLMAFSGARGSLQQVRQLAGIRGLMADPSGNIISIPIKSNFKEGLNITEYFISSYGARKGLVDTALRTADSGYLTRRLVDVGQDVIITEEDCESELGIELSSVREGYEEMIPLWKRLIGRTIVKNVSDPIARKTLAKAGDAISESQAHEIAEAGINFVEVRSVLTCKARRGICRACYGKDLSTNKAVSIGEAVGIIAAQSIGEPGTQLTMRTFHIGGVALHKGAKVEIQARHSGKVKFGSDIEVRDSVSDEGDKIQLITRESRIFIKVREREEEYVLPAGAYLKVEDGQTVTNTDTLAQYDPTYENGVTTSSGKVKFLGLEVLERKRQAGTKTVVDRLAKQDCTLMIYNPKLMKDHNLSEGTPFVREGDKVTAEVELAPGVESKLAGTVVEISKKGNASTISVAPAVTYVVLAGSRIYVEDGDAVKEYDLLTKVESIRRDPSKTRDIIQGLPRVEELFEARRPKDPVVLAEVEGVIEVFDEEGSRKLVISGGKADRVEYAVPYETRLRVSNGDRVRRGQPLTFGTANPHDVLRIQGKRAVQIHLLDEVQKIYRSQGVSIHDKHIEMIVRCMTRKVRIVNPGSTDLLPGELIDQAQLDKLNLDHKDEPCEGAEVLLGITKASLSTDSFISAASFQETARVLTEAAVRGKTDQMYGLKENVIIGKLIPAGTGFMAYNNIEVKPATFEEAVEPVEEVA